MAQNATPNIPAGSAPTSGQRGTTKQFNVSPIPAGRTDAQAGGTESSPANTTHQPTRRMPAKASKRIV